MGINNSFVRFQPVANNKMTTMAVGEEGGDCPPKSKHPYLGPPIAYTKAMNEDGGCYKPRPPIGPPIKPPVLTTYAMNEEGGGMPPPKDQPPIGPPIKPPIATTQAVGEEGGGIMPIPICPPYPQPPQASTEAVGEEGGGTMPPPKQWPPIGPPIPNDDQDSAADFRDIIKQFKQIARTGNLDQMKELFLKFKAMH